MECREGGVMTLVPQCPPMDTSDCNPHQSAVRFAVFDRQLALRLILDTTHDQRGSSDDTAG